MKTDIRVVIDEGSPRAADCMRVFWRRDVPVVSDKPMWVMVPEYDRPMQAYRLDVGRITPEERERLVQHLAGRYAPLLDDEINESLDKYGMPILADDCTVVVQHPLKWID